MDFLFISKPPDDLFFDNDTPPVTRVNHVHDNFADVIYQRRMPDLVGLETGHAPAAAEVAPQRDSIPRENWGKHRITVSRDTARFTGQEIDCFFPRPDADFVTGRGHSIDNRGGGASGSEERNPRYPCNSSLRMPEPHVSGATTGLSIIAEVC